MVHSWKVFAAGVVTGGVLAAAGGALAAAKTYQYTGVVTANTGKELAVDKGGEVWEFALDADTRGELKAAKGDKVTVVYRMFATKIEKK